jgi:Fe-S-cluster containining protein
MPLAPLHGEPRADGGDCVDCGRCCHHGPRTVHLLESDDERMHAADRRFLELFTDLDPTPPGWRFMKNSGERCAALDVSVPGKYPCAVYAGRAEDCRIVEPGSPACLEARKLGRLGSSLGYSRTGT